MWIDFLAVAAIGALLGAAELASRYRDAPLRALGTPAALTYIALNLFASIGCLVLIQALKLDLKIEDPSKLRVTQVLISGFGAMAFFRSSFFVFRAGNQDISVGPASVLQILLSALDSAVDRVRAEQRAAIVERIMDGVSFSKAKDVLPPLAVHLMRNLPREDADRMLNQVSLLKQELPERAKGIALGLTVLDVVGDKVLRSAVTLVKSDIQIDPLLEAVQKAAQKLLTTKSVVPLVPPPPPASPAGEATAPPLPPGNLPLIQGEIAPPAEGGEGPLLPGVSGV